MKTKSIIIAHKDKLRQSTLKATLSILDCEVKKTLSSGVRTLRYIIREKPDIAIIQEKLGDISAFEIAKEVAQKNVDTKFIIIFNEPTFENLFMARSLKIKGCFCDSQNSVQILSIVNAVINNEEGYCNYILGDEKSKVTFENFGKLSDIEIEILTLFNFYKDAKKVAQKLDVSSKKIETHQECIASKLNIKSSESVLTHWAEENEDLIKTLAF